MVELRLILAEIINEFFLTRRYVIGYSLLNTNSLNAWVFEEIHLSILLPHIVGIKHQLYRVLSEVL